MQNFRVSGPLSGEFITANQEQVTVKSAPAHDTGPDEVNGYLDSRRMR